MTDPSLDERLTRLRDDGRTARSRLVRLQRYSRGLSVALALVLVGFLAVLYGQVTSMYDPQNFEVPVQREAQNLAPTLEPELIALWEETAPVYGELALAKLEAALPQVQEASLVELDRLRGSLLTNAESQVQAALERIAERHTRQIREQLPRLSTEQGADELTLRWMAAIEGDFEEIVLHFHDLYSRDLVDLEATLAQFLPNDFEQMTEDQLFRQFVHLWLMKADHWVMLEDERRPLFDGADDVH